MNSLKVKIICFFIYKDLYFIYFTYKNTSHNNFNQIYFLINITNLFFKISIWYLFKKKKT